MSVKVAAWWVSLLLVTGVIFMLTKGDSSDLIPAVWFAWIGLCLGFLRCPECGLSIIVGYGKYTPFPYYPRLPSFHCSKCRSRLN